MNDGLMTPQHKNYIGCWVSKGMCIKSKMNQKVIKHIVNSCAKQNYHSKILNKNYILSKTIKPVWCELHLFYQIHSSLFDENDHTALHQTVANFQNTLRVHTLRWKISLQDVSMGQVSVTTYKRNANHPGLV